MTARKRPESIWLQSAGVANQPRFSVRQGVLNNDCLAGMQLLPDNCLDLVFADPPFNIGFAYDIYDDKKSYDDYMAWSEAWLAQVKRVLRPGGTFWLAIGDEYAADLKVLAQRTLGFHMVSWVIWHYTFGVNSPKKLTRSHAHLLYFTKGKRGVTFNAEAVKVPSARQLVYNDKRGKEGGRLPDDTWILRPQWLPDAFASGEDTWYVPRVCGTYKERRGTPNQMPERLLGRIIKLCSNAGDIVLDPFTGSGTTLATAKKLGRKFFGYELSAAYAQTAEAYLQSVRVGDELAGPPPQGEPDAT
jgi:site-specific DNA-methyltransferase (adenine-specific)